MSVIQMPGSSGDVVENAIDAKRRSENCMVDIRNALSRYNCAINPVCIISGRGIQTNFEIIPLDMVPKNLA